MSRSIIGAPPSSIPSTPDLSGIEPVVQQPKPKAQIENRREPHGTLWRVVSLVLGNSGQTFVFVGFLAVFYIGHTNDWKIPRFAELIGSSKPKGSDWCEEHSVPESLCVECNPKLLPNGTDNGWCLEHGVHNCVLHHSDIAQLKVLQTVTENDFERSASALTRMPRKENSSSCAVYKKRIQFASIESVKQAGVDVELVERRSIVETISGTGEIVYDPTRLASLASRLPGSVRIVEKNVGDKVSKGEVLAIIDATEVGNVKVQLLRSLAEEKLQQQNVSRLTQARDAIAVSRIFDAEAALAKAMADVLSAEQSLCNLGLPVQVSSLRDMSDKAVLDNLRVLGIPNSILAKLDSKTATANLLPIASPMDGIVVHRSASPGEVVDPSRVLFQVADTSQMWLNLNIPLESMDQLAVGQNVTFQADGSRNQIRGRLDWISTAADKQTRMVQIRVVLPNPDGRLRSETFGMGHVVLRSVPDAIVVPVGSSHWEGCCQIVFVRDKGYFDSPESPKVFHVRNVRLGATNGKFTEVIAGVLPGEVIATAGSDVLRAQLLKNNLGAGCDCCAK